MITAHAYEPATAFNEALEHWVERQSQLLGVVARDLYDRDYGYVVLGRDQHGQFRAIAESGLTVFPQGCLQ
jgi:hypothetical protein